MKRHFLYFIFTLFISSLSFSQIQVGSKKTKEKHSKSKTIKAGDTTSFDFRAFIGSSYGRTFRSLNENTKNPLFSDSLGERSNETPLNTWSFQLGFRSDISNYLMWEGGLSFMQNGESYSYTATDTMHSYESKYSWIGVPLKLYFKYDFGKFRTAFGVGVVPQMQLKFKRVDTFVNSNNTESTIKTKTINELNTFGVSVVGNVGIHYLFTSRIGLYLFFEYRQQLTPSHIKTYPYIHKGNMLGANFGLTIGI